MTLLDMSPSDVIAIIPARGGSKGIQRKNARLLAGKPLIAWTIDAAKSARCIAGVFVSTDDAQIAAIAAGCGAQVIHRPADISGDAASSESALLHALEQIDCGITVFLQCTSPLTIADDIDGTVEALRIHDADSALAVTPFHHFLWDQNSEGAVGINHDKRFRPRRQDRPPQYLETGAVYAMRTAGFRQAKHRFFGKTVTYLMPAERCMEIDEPADLDIASIRLRARQRESRVSLLPKQVQAVVFDFDGVMTDNAVMVSQDGSEAVRCDRGDGLGIGRLRAAGVPVLVLSSEVNPVVAARCRKLRIECLHGVGNKPEALAAWTAAYAIDPAGVVYVGNDTNDLGCLAAVGCGAVVADAHPDVRDAARMILDNRGGHGAVREMCDLVAQSLGIAQTKQLTPHARTRAA
jgi:YrbI family 3-deoxy-D-manno-octulosonate 8-phosphate phosphatase